MHNFPTIGLFEGRMRANFEENGMGYGKEIEMVRIIRETKPFTTQYAS